jgi:hypothetical protein
MEEMDYLLEHYRNKLGITKEQQDQLIEEQRVKNPVVLLEQKVDDEVANLDERTQGMQDVDGFTLDKTFQLDDRTEGMKEIDDYTLTLVFDLMARIEKLEGGN